MDVTVVATSIVVMGLITIIGAFLAHKVTITKDAKQVIILIVLNIAVPSIILNGVFNTEVTDQLLHQVILIFIISVLYHIIAIFVALAMAKLFKFESLFAKKMALLTALGNTGFIGIPLCATIFGPVGGLLAAIFDAALDVILFSIGVYMLQSGKGLEVRQLLKAFINIPFIAVIIGLTVAISGAEPPAFLKQLTGLLSGLAAPLAMLYIGMLLQDLFKRNGVSIYRQIWFPLIGRLLIFPLLMMTVLSFIQLDSILKNIVIILTAMPTFTLSAILFSRYTNDEETAVTTIAFSTLLSLMTIPLMAYLATIL
ncbi:AEC family transporter [Evansella tamaricis]|uniref:AEC family transporter n=1 Tax=Evansella tamaricis TaxID=2069301 RepID=A0ABS6JI44_9BACI|nr:AEC family transporter [Evansella tamaricis]MBU9713055.1 AEC family transporter [Evansella tamaricis]